MTTLAINDLAESKELDSKAMASVSGGIGNVTIGGPQVTGAGDNLQNLQPVDFYNFVGFPFYPYAA